MDPYNNLKNVSAEPVLNTVGGSITDIGTTNRQKNEEFIDSGRGTSAEDEPDLTKLEDRLRTFEGNKYKFKKSCFKDIFYRFAHAGFYYLGPGDQVGCFSCFCGLRDFKPNDDPLERHRFANPDCPYLLTYNNNDKVLGARSTSSNSHKPISEFLVEFKNDYDINPIPETNLSVSSHSQEILTTCQFGSSLSSDEKETRNADENISLESYRRFELIEDNHNYNPRDIRNLSID